MADGKDFLGGMAEGVGEGLKEKLGDKVHLDQVFSEGNLKKKRSSFWTCLIAGVLLAALALGAAVYVNAVKVDTFEHLLMEKVDYEKLGTDQLSVQSFARETIFYLTGQKEHWEPMITIQGFPASGLIPDSFRAHMATVRGWFSSATAVLLAGLGIAVLLLGRAVTDKKNGFSAKGYYLGAGVILALVGAVILWGQSGFSGLWAQLHKALIPDGIFAASEPIMQLFPVSAFEGYLKPVGMTFAILAAIVLALPLALIPASKLIARLPGKTGASSGAKRKPASHRSGAAASAAPKGKTTRKPAAKKPAAKKTTASQRHTASGR